MLFRGIPSSLIVHISYSLCKTLHWLDAVTYLAYEFSLNIQKSDFGRLTPIAYSMIVMFVFLLLHIFYSEDIQELFLSEIERLARKRVSLCFGCSARA
jgi:hypothetical protein